MRQPLAAELFYEKDSSDIASESDGLHVEDRRNGRGYYIYEPLNPQHITHSLGSLDSCVNHRFVEMTAITEKIIRNQSVLLEGKPGAGKSNILKDVEKCATLANVPVFRLALHINAGTNRTIDNTLEIVDQQLSRHGDVGRLVLLDNVDYGGYRGSTRRRKNAYEYAELILPKLADLIDDNSTYSIGTAHDSAWRERKWQWGDPLIDGMANNLLDAFNERYNFRGEMTAASVTELIASRCNDRVKAERVTTGLNELGLLKFHVANHVDVDVFLSDDETALLQVDQGRSERYGK